MVPAGWLQRVGNHTREGGTVWVLMDAQAYGRVRARANNIVLAKGDKLLACRLFFGDSLALAEQGLPPGIILMLRLMWECSMFFLLIFGAQYLLQHDNVDRNAIRSQCRLDAAEAAADNSCGYSGLAVSSSAPLLNGLGLLAYGACEEYVASEGGSDKLSYFGQFVRTDQAAYCAVSGLDARPLTYWFADLVLVLLLLWRLQSLERIVKDRADAFAWTTADYAVMLTGLDHNVTLVVADAALRQDLQAMGYGPTDIDHIEFGLKVGNEAAAREALREARRRLAEVERGAGKEPKATAAATAATAAAQAATSTSAGGGGGGALSNEAFDVAACEARVAALTAQPQLTTGHAFVVFRLEAHRNELVRIVRGAGGATAEAGGASGGEGGGSHAPFVSPLFFRSASVSQGRGVSASIGPEPSDVCWENLEVSHAVRAAKRAETIRGTVLLLLGSGLLLVGIQWAKRTFTNDFAIGAAVSDGAWVSQLVADPSVAVCLFAALVIALVAARVRGTVSGWNEAERHETRGESEAGLLWKLCGAFAANNVVMPVAVSLAQSAISSGEILSQAIYERTNLLTMAVVIISIQRVTADLPRALQALSLMRRHLQAPLCASSESQLESLWRPPGMRIALQTAQLYWLVACALLYAPLAPFFYGLAGAYCLFSFGCTKFGVVFWYVRPPALTTQLGSMFRRMVWLLLPPHLLLKLLVRLAAEPTSGAPYSLAYYLVAHLICLLALAAMRTRDVGSRGGGGGYGGHGGHGGHGGLGGLGGVCRLLSSLLSDVTASANETFEYQQLDALDTEGIPYADVPTVKGYPIDSYCNPFRRDGATAHRWQPAGFFGAPPPPAGAVERGSEMLDQNTAALSSSLPFEDLPAPPLDSLAESGLL